MMRYLLYNLILVIATPAGVLYLLCASKYRALLRRFRPLTSAYESRPLWIHACSVGEVGVASGLVRRIRERFPDLPVMLSVSTLSGLDIARAGLSGITVTLAPFDLLWSVRGFIRRAKPRMLAIIETELWPNMIREAKRCGMPVVVINGRISPRRFPVYKRYKRVMPPALSLLDCVAAQDDTCARRFKELDVPEGAIEVTGNMKYDAVTTEFAADVLEMMRRENGFSRHDVNVIFGSTRPGDEELAAACWRALKEEFPNLRFIIAPRHLQRIEEAKAPFQEEVVQCRSVAKAGNLNWRARVFVVDTIGELTRFYALSSVAVIGGSFFPGVEGHNPLEPAALGVPTVFGRFMGNFPEAAALLTEAEGAVQIERAEELPGCLRQLLKEPMARERIALKGRKAVLNKRGAVERNVALLTKYMERGE